MAKRKSRKGLFATVAVVAVSAVAGWNYWHKPVIAVSEYRTSPPAVGDIVQTVTANGQLSPLQTVDVGAQVNGNIVQLYADFNTKVTNGQLIAVLDPASYEARMVQAESDLASAKAQYNLAKVNARRAEELSKSKLISDADHDQTMASLEQMEANLKVREATLKSAMVDLSRTKIYSPMDGTVISRNMTVGQTVQASFSAPTLFQIANDLTRMQIAAMVSEADIGGVEEGEDVSFTVDAFPSRTFQGRVSQVRNQPTTNQNVVTYATIIEVRNPDLKLKPGMTANASITIAKKQNVVRLANAALRFQPPDEAVVRTNTIVLASVGTNAPASDPSGEAVDEDGMPKSSGGFQPPPEIRKRIIQEFDKNGDGKLDAAERKNMTETMRKRFAQAGGPGGMGGGMGGGMPGGMGGGGGFGGSPAPRRAPDGQPTIKTIYLVATNALPNGKSVLELQPVQVKLGITDGSNTEVLEGLKPGDPVVSSAVLPEVADAQPVNNPFGGPFGRRPR